MNFKIIAFSFYSFFISGCRSFSSIVLQRSFFFNDNNPLAYTKSAFFLLLYMFFIAFTSKVLYQ
ncbi:hypothetical protein C1645_750922 [Glomus cerebriforme]|uniref:Lipoprotein n=1 Tax=Glomus cerebriforme TaxID=658196 RepID=A0A397TIA3_9GLOM|nr:hypothetical protein C1645_750922 [Glomus cerebriforme]